MSFAYNADEGGEYCDWGADSAYTRAESRERALNNGDKAGHDERVLWARHGQLILGGPPDSFKFNAVFFDGHVETLGDLQGANPAFWAPKGTVMQAAELWPDVYQRFGIPSGVSYTVPN
jgi:prepilin-type processing-associated H-X9-DG protein